MITNKMNKFQAMMAAKVRDGWAYVGGKSSS